MDDRQQSASDLPRSGSSDAPEVRPPSEAGNPIDWPDRSHWSEFDRAIESARSTDLDTPDSRTATGGSAES